MKRQNTQPLGEAIRLYLKAMGVEQKLNEISIIKKWEEIIGTAVANKTDKIFINNKILYIKTESSIVKEELMMLKGGIIKKFNDLAKNEIVTKMVVY